MKTALITFRKVNTTTKDIKKLVSLFEEGGVGIDDIYTLSFSHETAFLKIVEDLNDTFDNVIVLQDLDAPLSVKELLSKRFSLTLVENENAITIIDKFNNANGVSEPMDYALLPQESTILPNYNGGFQGYMIEGDMLIVVLPDEQNQASEMVKSHLLPYMQQKYSLTVKKATIKAFGVGGALLDKALSKGKQVLDGVRYSITKDFGDVKIDLFYDANISQTVVDQAITAITVALGDKVYAEEDVTLAQRLSEVLRLRGYKLSTAESFTAGRIASSIISISGASEIFNEGIVAYSNDAKIKRLFVNSETLKQYGAVSKQTAYEMSAGLLKNPDTDYAVATTGIAGPKSDNTEKPVGLCYISVGNNGGIHVHKLNLKGDRETITQTAVNAGLYLALINIIKS